MSDEFDVSENFRLGFWGEWLPKRRKDLLRWQRAFTAEVERLPDLKEHPVITEFRELIRTDAVVRMYMTQMIEQIPDSYKEHHPRSVDQLLRQLNVVLTRAPLYYPKNTNLLAGTPFSAILIWTMGTPAGFAAYRNAKINAMFKKILGVWANYLDSRDSLYVLNNSPNGWMSKQAQEDLQMQDYQYDPKAEYWGFDSWNQFFTRKLAKGARPISNPDNDKMIASACDCTVYKIAHDVRAESPFWIKSQPYSLITMLDNNYVDRFVGGSVFQAFLSPYNYHRWHSPVTGVIRKAYVIEGLYFSQATSEGQDPTDQDHSEGYITNVQTRAIFFIEAKDKDIGLVCVMPVGMVEISSCIIRPAILEALKKQPKEGFKIKKGEEIGYFQFGGSTHCVVFGPGVIKQFFAHQNDVVQVGQDIAIAY